MPRKKKKPFCPIPSHSALGRLLLSAFQKERYVNRSIVLLWIGKEETKRAERLQRGPWAAPHTVLALAVPRIGGRKRRTRTGPGEAPMTEASRGPVCHRT